MTVHRPVVQVAVAGGNVACSWRVAHDRGQAAHYGLALARDMALPEDVLSMAARVVALLGDAEPCTGGAAAEGGVALRAEALQLAHKVLMFLYACDLRMPCRWRARWSNQQTRRRCVRCGPKRTTCCRPWPMTLLGISILMCNQ